MVERERINFLNQSESFDGGKYVVYWMQQAQRVNYNQALEYAVFRANQKKIPVIVIFVLTADYPEANRRHYQFMLEGLKETLESLGKKNIPLIVLDGDPVEKVVEFCEKMNPHVLVTDKGYLNVQRDWRKRIAGKVEIQMVEVETETIVPVNEVSEKEEYAARTIRPKILKKLSQYVQEEVPFDLIQKISLHQFNSVNLDDPIALVERLPIDQSVSPGLWRGGYSLAKSNLQQFILNKSQRYAKERNDPTKNVQSDLSPYLHFGQISSMEITVEIYKAVKRGILSREQAEVFLEELIVRRELAFNYCYYNSGYDQYEKALPEWAKITLKEHSVDQREVIYSLDELENGKTADEIWNACQSEMVKTGKMHGYMRMYWGKKILEWSPSPQQAFDIALYLNNKYSLDGLDPNSFAGVAWCFGKHDRPWGPQRPIFGLVRYMNDKGIKRKFPKWPGYVKTWTS